MVVAAKRHFLVFLDERFLIFFRPAHGVYRQEALFLVAGGFCGRLVFPNP
jgi:hypothetical protein